MPLGKFLCKINSLQQKIVWNQRDAKCGCSSMAELLLPKQIARVRFPSPAPKFQNSDNDLTVWSRFSGIKATFRSPKCSRPRMGAPLQRPLRSHRQLGVGEFNQTDHLSNLPCKAQRANRSCRSARSRQTAATGKLAIPGGGGQDIPLKRCGNFRLPSSARTSWTCGVNRSKCAPSAAVRSE